MHRLAQSHGRERHDSARIYETIHETPCAYRDCSEYRVFKDGELWDFCIRHLLRIDRKIGLKSGTIESLASMIAPTELRPDVRSKGVVYFMLIGNEVKIGFSTNLEQRAKALKADQVLAYFPGDKNAERTAHDAFAQWRVHGEYFAATPECLARIHRLTRDT